MQQIIKKFHPHSWMTPFIILATLFIVGCNNESSKTEENKTEAAPVEQVVEPKKTTDSLPPVDSLATPRPEPRKTK
jgi:PBP1b-binding outer membrane lipoprotein LpoB